MVLTVFPGKMSYSFLKKINFEIFKNFGFHISRVWLHGFQQVMAHYD